MRLRESYRIPLLLLACAVTALVFPRACTASRLGAGALLPGTAELTASESRDETVELREKNAHLAQELQRLADEIGARPPQDGPLGGAPFTRPRAHPLSLVGARVCHRDASTLRRSFTIDAGRADGVTEGMAVVCGDSLVGIVSCAIDHQARVVRIDDPGAAAAVRATFVAAAPRAGDSRPLGVARGTGDRDAGVVVSFLRADDAARGDVAVTAPGNPRIPEGLVLGEVVSFGDEDRDGSYEAEVRTLRDLDTVISVNVVRVDGDARFTSGAGSGR
jgi:rod shape-determining protein MreC